MHCKGEAAVDAGSRMAMPSAQDGLPARCRLPQMGGPVLRPVRFALIKIPLFVGIEPVD